MAFAQIIACQIAAKISLLSQELFTPKTLMHTKPENTTSQ